MTRLADLKSCSGCSACYSICPVGAISMVEDNDGFLYPKINGAVCLNCGKCMRVCPVLNEDEPRLPIKCFAGRIVDDGIREASSSGGVFSACANWVLEQRGCVYGCVIENDTFEVHHAKAEDSDAVAAMRKSKYVQSSVQNIFIDVKKELDAGRIVLFSGTPCQIAGLHKYLAKDYNNLISIGVICHGVPSHKMLESFTKSKQQKTKSTFHSFDFRSKNTSWKNFAIECKETGGAVKYLEGQRTSSYMKLFNYNFALRYSCYNCKSRNGRAPVDLLIGDFWGVEQLCPEIDDLRGTSVVLAYTSKGIDLLNRSRVVLKEIEFSAAIRFNTNVHNNSPRPFLRRYIYRLLNCVDFDRLTAFVQILTSAFWHKLLLQCYRNLRPTLVKLGIKHDCIR